MAICVSSYFTSSQAIAAEAPSVANQPTELAGMTPEIIQKVQDKATVLTQERKRRGRNIPEELMSQEYIRNFRTYASHPVNIRQTNAEGRIATQCCIVTCN